MRFDRLNFEKRVTLDLDKKNPDSSRDESWTDKVLSH
jgi:hypothetical protein